MNKTSPLHQGGMRAISRLLGQDLEIHRRCAHAAKAGSLISAVTHIRLLISCELHRYERKLERGFGKAGQHAL